MQSIKDVLHLMAPSFARRTMGVTYLIELRYAMDVVDVLHYMEALYTM